MVEGGGGGRGGGDGGGGYPIPGHGVRRPASPALTPSRPKVGRVRRGGGGGLGRWW